MSSSCCGEGLEGITDCITEAINCINKSLCSDDLRPYKMFVVTITWSGEVVGDGNPSSAEVEITPRPRIYGFEDLSTSFEEDGRFEEGEISADVPINIDESILAPELNRNQEFYYDIVTVKNGKRRRFFLSSVIAREPMSIFYVVRMRRLRSDSLVDGTIHDEIPMFFPKA